MPKTDPLKTRLANAALVGAAEAIRREFPDVVEDNAIDGLTCTVRIVTDNGPRYFLVRVSEQM